MEHAKDLVSRMPKSDWSRIMPSLQHIGTLQQTSYNIAAPFCFIEKKNVKLVVDPGSSDESEQYTIDCNIL
jgi:hypothetical protein